jgi:hypothetical protein
LRFEEFELRIWILWLGLLRLRGFHDDVAGSGEAQFVAGDGFDLVGVGFESFNFVGKIGVFFGEAFYVGLYAFNFALGAVHGEKAMGAEDVVKEKREDAEDEERASVLRPEVCENSFFRQLLSTFQVERIHLVASPTSLAEAAGVSAST